ncbi:histidine kinase [Burkholderia pyrrocinia]|uniref:Histidine kinase n=1 Tax=Burkholderia pyrrocinia TaxID=60550 RepID=A0A318I909_BURPY|nr:histidine kinase [Burkholderia pyrrocinia]SFW80871.1 histidine kinase [Burkholderia sp. NFACC33-1]SFY43268.1 histidine kinase [Burkholderia sp. NFPP32]
MRARSDTSPIPQPPAGSAPQWLRDPMALLGFACFNSVVGLGFWVIHFNEPVAPYLVVANAIGFCALLSSVAANRLLPRVSGLALKAVVIAPVSVFAGFEIAAAIIGGKVPHVLGSARIVSWDNYGPSFLVSAVLFVCVSLFLQSMRMRATLETERREAAEARQAETAARLALLQAQIEPHFLFNTLANVQSLIGRDPARASTMLDSLNRYLRASLRRTRNAKSTLGEELELVDALLKIASIRLGERLSYAIDVPADLHTLPFSPLLLQPLVENALLHGIEPSIDGGVIVIRGRMQGDRLALNVIDTGIGLGKSDTHLHGGVGLANVAARIRTLHGERGRVTVETNTGAAHGVTATLLIPID